MSVISRIHQNYSEFTKTELKIADYIIDNSSDVAFKTLEKTAHNTGVSTTSVIRFARSLGYQGYSEMQQSIQSSLLKKVRLPERYAENYIRMQKKDLMHDLLNEEIDSLNKTVQLMDPKTYAKAVSLIDNARRVYILGARTTYGLANSLASNLSQIRDNIHLLNGVGGCYPEEIAYAEKGDVCIVFLFPRYQKLMMNLARILKERGVTNILITTPPYDTIRHLGDVFLTCSLQSGLMTKDSGIPPMFICNYLFTCLTAANYEKTKTNLEKIEQVLESGYYFGV